MDGLVENICLECHSSSIAEHGTNVEYEFVKLMSLYVEISIGLVKMLVYHVLWLLKIPKSIFKESFHMSYINTTIICEFFSLGLQWQTRIEFGNVPLLI